MVNNYISNEDDETNEQIPPIVSIILCLLSLIPIIILLVTQLKYKMKKIKEDILLIERYFLYIIYIILTFIISVMLVLMQDREKDIYYYQYVSLLFFINIYIANIFSVIIEFSRSIKNPFYVILSIFSNKKKNIIIETITLLTSPVLFLINKYIPNSILNISDNESYYSINNIFVNGLIALTMILVILILTVSTCKFCGIQNKSKTTMRRKFISLYIVCVFLLIYSGVNYLICFNNTIFPNKYLIPLTSYSIPLLTIFIDCISTMLYIKSSDYYFYYLGKRKSISKFYKMCCKTKYYKPPIYEHITNNDVKKEIIMDTFQDTLEFNNINQLDIELGEYSLNVALASISVIFEHINQEYNINTTTKTNQNKNNEDILVNLLEQYNTTKQECRHFTLNKKDFEDNKLGEITNISNNIMDKDNTTYNNNVNVDIDYYYYDKFITAIINRNINLNEVKASMLSHLPKFPFLISKNAKESYFKTTKTLSIKTDDKKLMIEIFPDILDNKSNKNIVDSYINHMNLIKKASDKTAMKENEILNTVASATFLPFLLGVFKVKINSFSSFTVFISKNTILENAPSDVFNFWQLMRYSYGDQIEKLSTSKDKTSICITEDNLFNGMKILMRNYKLFSDTLMNDFNFLKQINAKNFSLLIMYYEFDQSVSKSISIDQNDDISKIRITASNFRVSDIKNFNFPEEGSNETISDLDKDMSIVKYNKDGNGFEAKFNNFKAIMFFCFENVFEFRGHSWKTIDYNKYQTDLLKNFDYMNLEDE